MLRPSKVGESSDESDSSNEGRPPPGNESDPEDPDEDPENPGSDKTLLPTIAIGIDNPKTSHTFEIDASGEVKRLPLQREFASGVRIPETWEDELEVRARFASATTLFDSEGAAVATCQS